MPHNLPNHPIFHDNAPGGLMEEFALRVLLVRSNWQEVHILGTAVFVGSFLALTARHVMDESFKFSKPIKQPDGNLQVSDADIFLLQVLPGPIYRYWRVERGWRTTTDIAILHVGLHSTSDASVPINWKTFALRATPPATGEKVAAFGYRQSAVQISPNPDGSQHLDINDVPTTSGGIVGTIFPVQRDSVMLSFPCFEVYSKFAHGMSGGAVLDDSGALCGLVCASWDSLDPSSPPLSYAATIWPILTTLISINRGDKYPHDVQYQMIDLALDGLISVSHLADLDPALFPGKTLLKQG